MTTFKNDVNNKFEYGTACIRDFSVETKEVTVNARGRQLRKVQSVDTIFLNGRPLTPTRRFWTSLQCRFGFSANIFRYFDHAEVFDRISERASDDVIRYCIESDANGESGRILAVTNPKNSCVRFNNLVELTNRAGALSVGYADGIVRSTHAPKVGETAFQILGDDFVNQFVIDTPIDGFGKPSIYLSLLRLICANGAVGYDAAFRSELSVGSKDSDVVFALQRAMDSFNNEEGFSAMRQRFEAAGKSWASVHETQKLYRLLASIANNGDLTKRGVEYVKDINGGAVAVETAMPVFHDFHRMTGDLSRLYGLANLDALTVKRQRTLPTACKVYDLLNFTSELATHHTKAGGARKLNAFIGDLISTDYDLEGTCDQFSDWQDFFMHDSDAIDAKEMLSRRHVG